MLIFSSVFILLSNAVSLRRDKSILFSRITLTGLICSSFIGLGALYIPSLGRGIGLFGGLFHATSITQIFHIFIIIISSIIIQLTSFYPRKVLLEKYHSLLNILRIKFNNSINNIRNKNGGTV